MSGALDGSSVVERTRRCRAKVSRRFRAALGGGHKDLAKALEKALWVQILESCDRDRIPKFWENPRFRYRYTTRALSLTFNIRTNETLQQKLVSGKVSVTTFMLMKPWEMKPELWEAAFDAAAKKELRNSEYNPDPATMPDGAFTCNKCKSKKTTYYMMQTRSADEPSSIFVQCLTCRKRWKTT